MFEIYTPDQEKQKAERKALEAKFRKAPQELIKREKAFINEMFGGDSNLEKISEELQKQIAENGCSEIIRFKISESIEKILNISMDYSEDDMIEVTIFKAAAKMDRNKLIDSLSSKDLSCEMQPIILSLCINTACYFHDIEMLKFLIDNTVDPVNLIYINHYHYLEHSSPIYPLISLYPDIPDREIMDLLFKNGLDLNKDYDGRTTFFILLEGPEEYSIELLDQVDLNQPIIIRGYSNQSHHASYLYEATYEGKFKLALGMMKQGIKIPYVFNLFNFFIPRNPNSEILKEEKKQKGKDEDRIEPLRYLLDNDYDQKIDRYKIEMLYKLDKDLAKEFLTKDLINEEGVQFYIDNYQQDGEEEVDITGDIVEDM